MSTNAIQKEAPNAPRITEVLASSFTRSAADVEGSTQSNATVCASEETAQFPKSQLDCAIFGSWVDRALDANKRLVNELDQVVMPFNVAVALWQQLERQNDQLNKMQRVLKARKEQLDAMEEGEAS